MVDYGNAPFLWLLDRPEGDGIGGNLCEDSNHQVNERTEILVNGGLLILPKNRPLKGLNAAERI